MKTKAPIPIFNLETQETSTIIHTYFEFVHLKQLYRQGWLQQGIPEARCESVAEHTFGVAVVAMLLADTYFPELDSLKILRMALLHDLGEIYAGDIIPGNGISREEKHRLEKESIAQTLARLPHGRRYLELWEEFENGESPEACFVRQIDKLEMALQASVYQHQGFGDLAGFYHTSSQALISPELQAILADLENAAQRLSPRQSR